MKVNVQLMSYEDFLLGALCEGWSHIVCTHTHEVWLYEYVKGQSHMI